MSGRTVIGKATAAGVAALLAAAAVLMGSMAAPADPVQQKKEELERIKSEVQRIDARLETITEQYNLTNYRIRQARKAIAEKEAQIAALTAELEFRKDVLGQRMRELYKSGNADVLEVLTESRTVDDLYTNLDRAQRISGNDVSAIASVIGSRQQVEAARAELEARKAELDASLAQLGAQKSQIEAELQRRRELVAGVEAEVNRLIAEEEARQAEARRAATTVRQTVSAPRVPPPPPPPYAPDVIKVAYAQLGKPYRYAGSGPDVFDCSGLVMYCYAQVGVSLPHSSYMQARCGVPVSYSELQPGDLVFFHGYGHVGLYIGNGQYIHAPRTGDVVRIADLGRRGDFCGAVRIR
ncbi:MAG: C40 family peptidase [Actinobacteria bacterium]|nr:C40 family peptidase [Actinomycetota bacterium]